MTSCNVFRHLFFIFLSLAALVLPRAAAQPVRGSSSSAYPYRIEGDVSSPLKIILAVLIFGMFFIAFFTLYLRRCFENSSGSRRALATASNLRSRQKLPCGLDTSIIDRFPVFIYSDVKELKIGKGALECAVCISEFADDERLRLLPKCDHVFHPDCIDAWLASHTTCPVCRANLAPDKLGGDSELTQEPTHSQIDEIRTENESQNQYIVRVEEEQVSPKFPRSHSTGHSLVPPGGNCERYTLRLPEEVRKQIAMLKRTKSCGCSVDLPHEESSCLRDGGECDGTSCTGGRRWNPDRLLFRSDRWIFAVTRKPPIIAKPGPVEKSDRPQTSSSSSSTYLPV